jgi:hypothetical protein
MESRKRVAMLERAHSIRMLYFAAQEELSGILALNFELR